MCRVLKPNVTAVSLKRVMNGSCQEVSCAFRVCYSLRGVCVLLTVGAAEHLHSEAHPSAGVPVQRDETQEACSHWVRQLVLHNSLWIHIPDKPLQDQKWTKKVVKKIYISDASDPGTTEKQNDLVPNVNSNIFTREQKSLFLAEHLKYKQNKNLNPQIAPTVTKCWQGEAKGKSSSSPWTYYLM